MASTFIAGGATAGASNDTSASTVFSFTCGPEKEVYTVNTDRVPYFKAWQHFTTSSSTPASTTSPTPPLPHHESNIPFLSEALHGLTHGYRTFFRQPTLSTLPDIHILLTTLDFLLIPIIPSNITTEDVISDIKSAYETEVDGERASTKRGKDATFQLLYLICLGEVNTETIQGSRKEATVPEREMMKVGKAEDQKIYNAVVYVLGHARVYKSQCRRLLKEAFLERFVVSEKQMGVIRKWERNGIEEEDETTEEGEEEEEDFDDYYGYSS